MEQHFLQVASQSKVVQTFTNFYMHEFIERNKRKVAEGNCLILGWDKVEQTGTNYYLKMNNFEFCKRINQSTFIKVHYPKSSSYIFFNEFNDNMVFAVSLLNQSPQYALFEETLRKNGEVVDYLSSSLKYETKIRVDFHIDHVLQNEIIINFNKSAKIAKVIGGFFGTINKKISKTTAEAQAKFQDQLKRISRQTFSDSTKSKWDSFVQKASNLNEKMTEIIRPLNETIGSVVNQLGQKYNSSTNQFVVTVREFSKEAEHSINEGYNGEGEKRDEGLSSDLGLKPSEDNSINPLGAKHPPLNEQIQEKSPYPNL